MLRILLDILHRRLQRVACVPLESTGVVSHFGMNSLYCTVSVPVVFLSIQGVSTRAMGSFQSLVARRAAFVITVSAFYCLHISYTFGICMFLL